MNFLKKIFSKKEEADKVKPKALFEKRDDDVYLVSYPKSGNTWVRFLIGNYLTNCEMDFANGHLLMPDIHHDPALINNVTTKPRFIKSHFPYRPAYKNVIYLVRDGREACVSYYFFQRKMKYIPLETTFSEFIEKYFFSGKDVYGEWDKHIYSWLRDNKVNVLVVRYEDMLADTLPWLRKMLEFSGIEIDEDLLKRTVEKCAFGEMQKDEVKHKESLKLIGHDSTHTGYGIIRSGKTDSWKEIMNEDEKKKFLEKYGDALRFMNYEL